MIPAVSVVIPTYNRAAFLPAAVRSVQAQTFSDWELIVVDDGSTDASIDIITQFTRNDARIRLVENRRAHGPAGARNSGILAAQGEAVAFLDSDDAWAPTLLAKLVDAMVKHENTVLVGSDIQLRSVEDPNLTMKGFVRGTMLPWWSTYPPAMAVLPCERIAHDFSVLTQSSLAISAALAGFLWVHTSSTMIRRSAALAAGLFDERLQRTEDIDLWLKLSKMGTFTYVDEVLAIYDIEGRDHGTGKRYEGQDRTRKHTKYREAVFHLELIKRIARTHTLTAEQATLARHRRAAHHRHCLQAAVEARNPMGLRHVAGVFGSDEERGIFLRWLKGRAAT